MSQKSKTVVKIVEKKEIETVFDLMKELRPHLLTHTEFSTQIARQIQEGYSLIGLEVHNKIEACLGYRIFETLAWGKILYIDDLITAEKSHGNGYGAFLLNHTIEEAKRQNCHQVHLDSGYQRHAAHHVYLKHKFKLSCHHLALVL